jgi:hypothetical protein
MKYVHSKPNAQLNLSKASFEELTWTEVREEFYRKNPELGKIIDDLSPSKEYTLFKAKYPYGSEILKAGELNLPINRGLVSIRSNQLNSKIHEKLAYNLNSNPVSMILKNSAEIFMVLENNTIPLYGLVKPGKVFGTWRVLNPHTSHNPAFIWDMTAGARSVFMMPKISEQMRHNRLRREFDMAVETPKSLLDHWEIFRALANSERFGEAWETEILFFSKIWFDKLDDEKWLKFKCYLLESAWSGSEFLRNQFIWNVAFSLIQKYRNIKPNPYIADTVKHLLGMGIGSLPGFSPSIDDSAAPVKRLQEIYVNIYQLAYAPVIMEPHNLSLNVSRPIYYSLAYPTTMEFSPKSRLDSSKISDVYEIKSLLAKYIAELSENDLNLAHTPISDLAKMVQYDFFHTDNEQYPSIKSSKLIPKEDSYFQKIPYGSDKEFPENSSFIKGCIRITKKSSA